ncbi:MAG: hypothetical protein WBF67_00405 [Olleya sp.]
MSDSSNEGPTNILFYDNQNFNQTQLFLLTMIVCQTIFAGLSYRFGGGKYSAKSRKQRDKNEAQDGEFM